MILAWLLLLTGLTISAVAIYYSVIGLAAIFAAATIPIYIMGGSLEVAKLVCASWLKANWDRAPALMKIYMTTAVMVLMFITSMGIFGFLSKAHTDQSLVSGDVMSKIAVYDEKIKTEKENIDVARKAIKQLDDAVDQVMARSVDERGADKANQIRRAQQRERAALQRDINNSQSNIAKLQSERAPIAAEVRKVEAEVGPIKYIAKLIYGDDPDTNLLEKAVTWVIILIVAVFDPLAVIMLLAAQMTFGWYREQKEQGDKPDAWVADVGEKPTEEELKDDLFPTYEEITPKEEPKEPAPHHPDTHPYLKQGFAYPADWAFHPPIVATDPEPVKQDYSYIEESNKQLEEEMRQAALTVDSTEVKVDEPKYQIIPELEESSKKKIHDQGKGSAGGEDQEVTYVQNQEQTRSSLWFKIRTKQNDPFKPLDRLHIEFDKDGFEGIIVSPTDEPELYQFLEDIKTGIHKYGDYPEEQINYFASRIYELRKNQSNNPT